VCDVELIVLIIVGDAMSLCTYNEYLDNRKKRERNKRRKFSSSKTAWRCKLSWTKLFISPLKKFVTFVRWGRSGSWEGAFTWSHECSTFRRFRYMQWL